MGFATESLSPHVSSGWPDKLGLPSFKLLLETAPVPTQLSARVRRPLCCGSAILAWPGSGRCCCVGHGLCGSGFRRQQGRAACSGVAAAERCGVRAAGERQRWCLHGGVGCGLPVSVGCLGSAAACVVVGCGLQRAADGVGVLGCGGFRRCAALQQLRWRKAGFGITVAAVQRSAASPPLRVPPICSWP